MSIFSVPCAYCDAVCPLGSTRSVSPTGVYQNKHSYLCNLVNKPPDERESAKHDYRAQLKAANVAINSANKQAETHNQIPHNCTVCGPARRAEGNWFLEEGRRYLVEYHWYSNYWSVETSF